MKNVALAVAAAVLVLSATRAEAACDYPTPDPADVWTAAWISPNGLRTYWIEGPCYVYEGDPATYTARVILDPSCTTSATWVASNWSIVDEGGTFEDPNLLLTWTPQTVVTVAQGFALDVTNREWVQAITTVWSGIPVWHRINFTFSDHNGGVAPQCSPSGHFWTMDEHTIGVIVDPYRPIAISPADASVPALGSQTFVATGGSHEGWIWSLATNASGGSIDPATGVYTAGSTAGVTDIVQVTDSAANIGTTSVSVTAAAVSPVSISPATATVRPRGTQTFTASGGSGTGWIWSLETNASGGSIDASTGEYTAGRTPNVTDVVEVTDSLGNVGTATVTVDPRPFGCGSTGGGGSAMVLGLAVILFARNRQGARRQI